MTWSTFLSYTFLNCPFSLPSIEELEKINMAKDFLHGLRGKSFNVLSNEQAQNEYQQSIELLLDVGVFLGDMHPSIFDFLGSLSSFK